jgi:hypothetical protein
MTHVSQVTESLATTFVSRSVTVRLRVPREVLAAFEAWAAKHGLPRSEAVRILALRGLAYSLTGSATCP